jgi:hypothetical protein
VVDLEEGIIYAWFELLAVKLGGAWCIIESSSSSSSIYCKILSIRSRLQIRLMDIEPVTDSN